MMRFVSILAAGAFSLMATSAFAVSPQVDKEIAAAATHAGLAAEGADIMTVHMHLHHALNCLVGPKGKGFSAKDMNPCSALGNGAVVDAGSKSALIGINAAIGNANDGLASDDLAKAKADATAVQSMLLAIK